jgi:hypothetical protein
MASPEPVLLIDDGELDDVAELLSTLGIEPVRVRPHARPEEQPAFRLLVTPARCALERGAVVAKAELRVALTSAESRTLRQALRREGFDYLVRRPVHPEALRWFLARLLYRGHERRRAPRAAIGAPASLRFGFRRRDATLVDLSRTGCRLALASPPREGSSVSVQIPDPEAARPHTLRGTVSRRMQPRPGDPTGAWTVAITFERGAEALRDTLERLVAAHAAGPAPWSGDPVPGLVRNDASTREERHGPRRQYEKRVIALAETGAKVLLARDLSAGGLRVEAGSGLATGSLVSVALHGSPLSAPLVLKARVVRRDGAGSAVLRFEDVDTEARERLEKLLADQPEIECLKPGRASARRRVVTRVIGSD